MKKLFSKRLDKISLDNRFQSFYGLKAAFDLPTLDFGIGQDNFLVTEGIKKELFNEAALNSAWRYAEDGEPVLLTAFSTFARKNYGIELDVRHLAPTMGIKEALNTLAFLLIDPEDYVVATTPGYNVFQRKAKLLGGQVLELPLQRSNNFWPNFKAVSPDIWRRTKVLLLNYPNNPTGAKATSRLVRQALDLAGQYDFLVVNDGAYLDYSGLDSPFSFLSEDKSLARTIELYSASKTFGMTGARLGLMAGPAELIALVKKYRDQENSGQFVPLQKAYAYALAQVDLSAHRQKYLDRAHRLKSVLADLGFRDTPYAGAFYLFYDAPSYLDGEYFETASALAGRLKAKYGIIVIPYDESRALRFSLTIRRDDDILALAARLGGHKFAYHD